MITKPFFWTKENRRIGAKKLRDHASPADGPAHGWTRLFADKHPYAGGPEHYAAYLAGTDGFEVELVAD
jgi:hypothetical protein